MGGVDGVSVPIQPLKYFDFLLFHLSLLCDVVWHAWTPLGTAFFALYAGCGEGYFSVEGGALWV